MEHINERGVGIDVQMLSHAAKLAAEDRLRMRARISKLTGDEVTSVDQVARLTGWLMPRLGAVSCAILTEKAELVDEDSGDTLREAKYSLTRSQVQRVLARLSPDAPAGLAEVLQLRLYGGSRTPSKFGKMLSQHVDGVLYGSYVFNGAGHTGRASSRGVQIHNLARDILPKENAAIEAVRAGCSYDTLAALHPDHPVARQLSLLIRPTLVPEGDTIFVWSDWSQIEARILPWLAGDSPGARARLYVFRDVDADPRRPDLYTRTAAELSRISVFEVTKELRQRGKVAELALGYGGGVGALHNMAAGYGLSLSDKVAKATVDAWRAANPWCVRFWDQLQHAVESALQSPGKVFRAGRISYTYIPSYLGGSLFCELPSTRALVYRAIKYERVAELDDNGELAGYVTQLRFSRSHGRTHIWRGLLCENVVQAVAADCLRETLRRLEEEYEYLPGRVRAHSHDEIITECSFDNAELMVTRLREVMQRGFAWSKGLPLMSDETEGYYYSKHPEAHGL
jgi:DNA polymerase